ncbi:MAG: hypothetical protein AAGF92_00690 [Myxococcota bacterium]
MSPSTGLRFRRDDGPVLREVAEINEELSRTGGRITPLDLSGQPPLIRDLLDADALDANASARLMEHFLLSRPRLLSIIADAGRTPGVPNGGALETRVLPHDYTYPQLYQVTGDFDFGKFDAYHRNVSDDGTAVDEILQLLAGGPMRVLHLTEEGETLHLDAECPSADEGWLLTYGGGTPHSGRFGDARLGSKALVQVIGPASWTMDYDVPQGAEPPPWSG